MPTAGPKAPKPTDQAALHQEPVDVENPVDPPDRGPSNYPSSSPEAPDISSAELQMAIVYFPVDVPGDLH